MYGVLCLHGFTGSPKEVEPFSTYLKTNTDWIIKTPVLPGHGIRPELKGIRYKDWLQFAEEELEKLLRICTHVSICGFSMGGLIGGWLATKYPVEKLILLSPAAYFADPILLGKDMVEFLKGVYRGNPNTSHWQRYKKALHTPIPAYLEFMKLARFIRPTFKDVKIPTLIIHGKSDYVVPEKSARFVYEMISSKEKRLLFIEEADHMICYCPKNKEMFSEITRFLEGMGDDKKIASVGV